MFQLTSLLTAGALLVHLLAGCCWHHAHASPVEAVDVASACCHHSESTNPASEPSPHGDTCEEGRCVTIEGTVIAVSPPADLASPLEPGVLPLRTAMCRNQAGTECFLRIHGAGPPRTPVALHQLLRV